MKEFNAHVLHSGVVQPLGAETKRAGSETRAEARGWGRENSLLAGARAGQPAIRWKASSVAE